MTVKTAVTISLVPEARGGPFVFWDGLEAGCASAARHGFDAVEIFPPSADAIDPVGLEALLARGDLRVAAIGTGAGWVKHKLRLTDPDAGVRKHAVDFIVEMGRLAARFGAPTIVGSMQGRWGDGVEREQALDWLADGLARASAQTAGVVPLLYEPLNRYETNLFNRAGDAADFLRERGLGHVQLLCDLFHMAIEERDIAATLRKVRDGVGHIHFADSNRQAAGLGHSDLRSVISALRDIGFAGYLSAEILPLPDSETAAAQTMRTIRSLLKNP